MSKDHVIGNSIFGAYIADCYPPKGILNEAKSARRAELLSQVKVCTAIKLKLGKSSLVRFWDKTARQVLVRI